MADFYYYIKKGGLATGDAGRSATKRTGSFAAMGTSAYYDNIYDVFAGAVPTTAPAPNNEILISDLHLHNYLVDTSLGVTDDIKLYSVDDANAENYKRGAAETGTGSGVDITCMSGKRTSWEGISIETGIGTLLIRGVTTYTSHSWSDCELKTDSAGAVGAHHEGVHYNFQDVDIVTTNAGYDGLRLSKGTSVYMRGGSVSDGIGGNSTDFFLTNAGDCILDLMGVDIKAAALISGGSTYNVDGLITRCKLASGLVTSTSASRESMRGRGIIWRSCDIGDGYHYFKHDREHGVIDEDTAIYRTAGATYDGTNGFSAEMVAEATAEHATPLEFELYNGWIDTADFTATVTAKVHFATNDAAMAVDSSKVWFEFEHADGADNALSVIATNRANSLAAGTAPTTETALWTGLDGTDQQLSMTIAATIGASTGNIASGVVRIRMFLAGAGDTIFGCPQVEFS